MKYDALKALKDSKLSKELLSTIEDIEKYIKAHAKLGYEQVDVLVPKNKSKKFIKQLKKKKFYIMTDNKITNDDEAILLYVEWYRE